MTGEISTDGRYILLISEKELRTIDRALWPIRNSSKALKDAHSDICRILNSDENEKPQS